MALTILSFAIIPLSMFVRSGTRSVEGTRDIAAAVFFASKTLEASRSFPFELLRRDAETPAGAETAEEVLNRDNVYESSRVKYTRKVEIRPLAAGAGFDGRLLHLTVSWTAGPDDKPLEYQTWTVLSRIK